jgi:hypothetical protein
MKELARLFFVGRASGESLVALPGWRHSEPRSQSAAIRHGSAQSACRGRIKNRLQAAIKQLPPHASWAIYLPRLNLRGNLDGSYKHAHLSHMDAA